MILQQGLDHSMAQLELYREIIAWHSSSLIEIMSMGQLEPYREIIAWHSSNLIEIMTWDNSNLIER